MGDIKATILNLTNNLAKTSGDLVKNTKLNIELANEEENLKSLYIEAGKKVHEIYMFGGSLGKFFDDKYADILVCEGKITALKDQVDSLKGVKACLKCGKGVARTSEFCPNCGARMFTGTPEITDSVSLPLIMDTVQAPVKPAKIIQEQATASPSRQTPAEAAVPESPVKICGACGAKNTPGARFCLGCGRII